MNNVTVNPVWAKARTIKPLQMNLCSDTKTYHSMTVPKGTLVNVGKMPTELGEDNKWCVLFQRTKGYFICGFYSEKNIIPFVKSELTENGQLDYEDTWRQNKYNAGLLTTLSSGAYVTGKVVTKSMPEKFEVILKVLKKALKPI